MACFKNDQGDLMKFEAEREREKEQYLIHLDFFWWLN